MWPRDTGGSIGWTPSSPTPGALVLAIADTGGIFFKPLANFQFDALMGGPLIGEAFMEGCYQLGKEHPTFCASIYLVAERRAA